jgi:argininosuccinate lyase
MQKPWEGRFKKKTKKAVETFTSSVSFDKHLWKYDIEGSIAHTKMLKKQKLISSKDAESILKGLKKIKQKIQAGKLEFRDSLEDVHMNIESALTKEIGAAGGKLHTARSRNDQIALDLRLFLRNEIEETNDSIRVFQAVLVTLAEKHFDVIMPGFTHLQKAQPVLLSHHFLAFYEMLERDVERFEDCRRRLNVLPLGSCALAGTNLPIDRKYVAKLLKFPSISKNSMDAVSDRDFVIEYLSAASILMVHLSRLSEELILWNCEEFCFIELPDSYATGSSIMPQKKNPDVLELIRGKTGRVFGNLLSLLVTMKGLPLAYNRDMQEDKEPLFDSINTVKECLSILTGMMRTISFNTSAMRSSAEGGFPTATDLAEYLVKKGVAFREAHRIAGKVVRYCIHRKKTLKDLELKEFKQYSRIIGKDVYSHLSIDNSVNQKRSYGGTSKKNVRSRIRQIKSGK